MKTLVRIEKDVPLTIFDELALAKQVDKLFNGSEEKMKERINEIIKFINSHDSEVADELSYENIALLFKGYFFELILNEAVEKTFSGHGNYDVLDNVLSLISKEKLETAIMGKQMIDAFSNAIRSVHLEGFFTIINKGSVILLLEKEFLGKSIYPIIEKKKNDDKNNCCGECGCSCTCDGGCNGDTKKCTSKEAIEKGCNHHCDCYIGPLAKNLQK